jgi:aminoglycoside phosphotransferase (APT) family kinase protein
VAAIEDRIGPVVKAEAITSGLMPGLAAILHTPDARYFVKAAPVGNPAYHLYEREAAANAILPAGMPAPPMLLATYAEGWLVMLFAYLDAADADLSPGSVDLPRVIAALRAIAAAPAAATAPSVAGNVAALQDKAAALLAMRPSGSPCDMYRAAISGFDTQALSGDRLVHYDLHPGNLKVTPTGTVNALDWAFACAGARWIDAAFLAPRLIEAGHTPAAAEQLLAQLPGWQAAPATSVTALAALWTMFREYKAHHGPEQSRPFRAQAAHAGRTWITYRMS